MRTSIGSADAVNLVPSGHVTSSEQASCLFSSSGDAFPIDKSTDKSTDLFQIEKYDYVEEIDQN